MKNLVNYSFLCTELLDLLPETQKERVFSQEFCDINFEFLGFIDIYKNLSMVIPENFTVIDFGCAYNAQCFYFKDHKKYIAVDVLNCEKFKTDNCEIFNKSIEKFISENIHNYDLEETFAICSYVPNWGTNNIELVKKNFKNVFTYYPSDKKNIIIPEETWVRPT